MRKIFLFAGLIIAVQIFFVEVLLISVVIINSAHADSLDDKFKADKTEYAQIEHDQSVLVKRWDELSKDRDVLGKRVDQFKSKRDALNGEMAVHKVILDSHAYRCDGTFDDKKYVEDCNAEIAKLNKRSDLLNKENGDLNDEAGKLLKAVDAQNKEVDEISNTVKANIKRQNELSDDEHKIFNQLKGSN
jgi:hypothetical protein